MFKNYFWVALILLSSCGNSSAKKNSVSPDLDPYAPPLEIDRVDFKKISNLLPTTYYVPQEKKIDCKGSYGGKVFDGSETSIIKEKNGDTIAEVCTRFYKFLLMEGTAILKDRGEGERSINYSGVVDGEKRFHTLGRCSYGEGVRRNLCLLPYHTLAADNKVHKIDDIIYIPKAKGLELPDGSIHEGYFIVRDTGSAFNGVGGQRVDMFTGIESDRDNLFLKSGFTRKSPMQAYKIKGPSAELVKQKLKDRFGELY